jgi:hypothetical protein
MCSYRYSLILPILWLDPPFLLTKPIQPLSMNPWTWVDCRSTIMQSPPLSPVSLLVSQTFEHLNHEHHRSQFVRRAGKPPMNAKLLHGRVAEMHVPCIKLDIHSNREVKRRCSFGKGCPWADMRMYTSTHVLATTHVHPCPRPWQSIFGLGNNL